MGAWLLLLAGCGKTGDSGGNGFPTDTGCELATFYVDGDGDGYGSNDTIEACATGPGVAAVSGDCADDDAAVSPDAEEDCDNTIDDDDCRSDHFSQWTFRTEDGVAAGNGTSDAEAGGTGAQA